MQSCPSVETLRRYSTGTLQGNDAESVETHLDTCEVCQQSLAQMFESGLEPDWLGLARYSLQTQPDPPSESDGTAIDVTAAKAHHGEPESKPINEIDASHSIDSGNTPADTTVRCIYESTVDVIDPAVLNESSGALAAGDTTANDTGRIQGDTDKESYPAGLKVWKDRTNESEADVAAFPESLGRYRLVRLLGGGGFGRVFLAFDEKLKRQVAIKIPHASVIANQAHLKILLSEAQTLAALDHPGIAPIFDVGSTESVPLFLVSKLVEGDSLAGMMQSRKFDVASAVSLIARTCRALDYAHQRGIIHRDVKPHNILLDAHDDVFLTDFGLAWHLTSESRDYPNAGTPEYMSPEHRKDLLEKIDHRTDIYSAGIVLAELLSSDPANRNGSHGSQNPSSHWRSLSRMLSSFSASGLAGQTSILAAMPASLPKRLRGIVSKATANAPSDRYATAADMAKALEEFGEELRANSSMSSSRAASGKRVLSRTTVAAIVMSIVFLLGLPIWYYVAQRYRASEAVSDLLEATPANLETRLLAVRPFFQSVRGVLNDARISDDTDKQLRAKLALVHDEPVLLNELSERLLASNPEMAEALAKILAPYAAQLQPRMWKVIESASSTQQHKLNAAAYLAAINATDVRWTDAELREQLCLALTEEDLSSMAARARSLNPIRRHLIDGAKAITTTRSGIIGEQLLRVYNIWEMFARDSLEETVDVLVHANPRLFNSMLQRLTPDPKLIQALRRTFEENVSNTGNAVQVRMQAAIALMHVGQSSEYWGMWKHSPDCANIAQQSYIIGGSWVTVVMVVDHLNGTRGLQLSASPLQELHSRLFDPVLSSRRHILCALINHSLKDELSSLPTEVASRFDTALQYLIEAEPDAGMRAAAQGLFRMMHGATLSATPQAPDAEKRNWFTNSLGETMICIPPTEFVSHTYAIASTELQQRHFKQFISETGYVWSGSQTAGGDQSNESEIAQASLSWYDCAAFCNWLSRREGLTECYLPNEAGTYSEGMSIKPDYLQLNGYRLPTGSEWEQAARAGSDGEYSFGRYPVCPFHYAWLRSNSANELHRVGELRPNSLGLFDTHGNACEWTLDVAEGEAIVLELASDQPRICRGGCYSDSSVTLGFSVKQSVLPSERLPTVGARIVRSLVR